jgi:hypothetical protein
MGPPLFEADERARLADQASLSVQNIDCPIDRVGCVKHLPVRAEGRPVGDDDAGMELGQLLAVPAPEGTRALFLLVVHGAEINGAVRTHMAVIDSVVRLVLVRRHDGLRFARPEIEAGKSRLEAGDDHILIGRQSNEAHPLGRIDPEVLLRLRMVAPDARVLDIDPEERVRAMVPDGSFAQDAGARHRHMGCFRMNGWMCHVSSPQSL